MRSLKKSVFGIGHGLFEAAAKSGRRRLKRFSSRNQVGRSADTASTFRLRHFESIFAQLGGKSLHSPELKGLQYYARSAKELAPDKGRSFDQDRFEKQVTELIEQLSEKDVVLTSADLVALFELFLIFKAAKARSVLYSSLRRILQSDRIQAEFRKQLLEPKDDSPEHLGTLLNVLRIAAEAELPSAFTNEIVRSLGSFPVTLAHGLAVYRSGLFRASRSVLESEGVKLVLGKYLKLFESLADTPAGQVTPELMEFMVLVHNYNFRVRLEYKLETFERLLFLVGRDVGQVPKHSLITFLTTFTLLGFHYSSGAKDRMLDIVTQGVDLLSKESVYSAQRSLKVMWIQMVRLGRAPPLEKLLTLARRDRATVSKFKHSKYIFAFYKYAEPVAYASVNKANDNVLDDLYQSIMDRVAEESMGRKRELPNGDLADVESLLQRCGVSFEENYSLDFFRFPYRLANINDWVLDNLDVVAAAEDQALLREFVAKYPHFKVTLEYSSRAYSDPLKPQESAFRRFIKRTLFSASILPLAIKPAFVKFLSHAEEPTREFKKKLVFALLGSVRDLSRGQDTAVGSSAGGGTALGGLAADRVQSLQSN